MWYYWNWFVTFCGYLAIGWFAGYWLRYLKDSYDDWQCARTRKRYAEEDEE